MKVAGIKVGKVEAGFDTEPVPVAALTRTFAEPGSYRLKVEVRDSGNLSAAATVLLRVQAAPLPEATLSPDGVPRCRRPRRPAAARSAAGAPRPPSSPWFFSSACWRRGAASDDGAAD